MNRLKTIAILLILKGFLLFAMGGIVITDNRFDGILLRNLKMFKLGNMEKGCAIVY